jgi:hypothetical protein
MSNFNFSAKSAKESQPVRRSYLDAGIHQNCSLVEYGIKATANGTPYVGFVFEQDDTKATADLKVWYPKPESVQPREEETLEQAQQREINKSLSQLLHVAETVTGKEITDINATSFEDFANKVIARIKGSKLGKVKVKLTYDKNGQYAVFPNGLPFLEMQEIEPTRLKFTKFELENRMKKAEAPQQTISAPKEEDKLPF